MTSKQPKIPRARIWTLVVLSVLILIIWSAVQLVYYRYSRLDF